MMFLTHDDHEIMMRIARNVHYMNCAYIYGLESITLHFRHLASPEQIINNGNSLLLRSQAEGTERAKHK